MFLPHLGLALCLLIVWWAALVDFRTFTIPHKFSWALMALWIPFAMLALYSGLTIGDLALQAFGGLLAFILGIFLFATGIMGGGDIKLLAALTPLLRFNSLPAFLILVALSGLLWAIVYGTAQYLRARHAGEVDAFATARSARLPYGPAIAMGLTVYSVAPALLA